MVLSGWKYKKDITISPATGIANLQVKVVLTTTNFNYSLAKANGEDLRFTDSSDVLQDYWIETWNASGDSTIWVEVKTISTSNIYLYFGNSGASAVSSGDNTFEFFEPWDSYSTSDWTSPQNAFATISSNELKLSPTNGGAVTVVGSASYTHKTLQTKFKFSDNLANTQSSWIGFRDGNGTGQNYAFFIVQIAEANIRTFTKDGTTGDYFATGVAKDTAYHDLKIIWESGSIKYYIDGSLVVTRSTGVSSSSMSVVIHNDSTAGNTGNNYTDWMGIGPSAALSSATVESETDSSITSNASILKNYTKTLNSDASILKSYTETINSNAQIHLTQYTKTLNSDTFILKNYTETINSDTSVKKTQTETLNSEAFILKSTQAYGLIDNFDSYSLSTWEDPKPAFASIVAGEIIVNSTDTKNIVESNSTFLYRTLETRAKLTDSVTNTKHSGVVFYHKIGSQWVGILADQDRVYAWSNDGTAVKTDIGALDTDYHTFKIVWTSAVIYYYIDGELKSTQTANIPPWVFAIQLYSMANTATEMNLTVDWIKIDGLLSDAFITKAYSETINSDARILKQTSQTLNSDTLVKKSYTKTLSSNASILKSGEEGSIYQDAFITKAYSETINSNAFVIKSYIETLNSDAQICSNQYTETLNSDANILDSLAETIDSDSWILKSATKTLNSDARILKATTETINSDAVIYLTQHTNTLNSDAEIISQTKIETLDSDAFVLEQAEQTINSDSAILDSAEKTLESNAFITEASTGTLSSDCVIKKATEKTLTSDANVLKPSTETINSDAFIFKTSTETIESNAFITKAYIKTLASNANILESSTKTINSNAFIAKEIQNTLNSNASITKAYTETINSEAFIIRRIIETLNSDALIVEAFVGSLTSDAWIVLGTIKTLDSIAVISLEDFAEIADEDWDELIEVPEFEKTVCYRKFNFDRDNMTGDIDKSTCTDYSIKAEVQPAEIDDKAVKAGELNVGDAEIFLSARIVSGTANFRPKLEDEVVWKGIRYRIDRITFERVGRTEVFADCMCKRIGNENPSNKWNDNYDLYESDVRPGNGWS